MKQYNHARIEKKWQREWDRTKLYAVKDTAAGKKNEYVLVEFPYPSGNLHVGHWYAFAIPDIYARARRMQGKNVLYPIGFDAFGLPAENAAIKRKINPRTWTYKNIAHMRKQIVSMGASFDWNREVVTCDPAYYKWTQWLFLEMYKKGLVYRKNTAANWCPSCKTVLANEQVVGGSCERCSTPVEQRSMPQWNIAITKYADRLIDDLAPLNWPEAIKDSQRNWIGRSEGAEIDFGLTGVDDADHVIILHGRNGSPDNFAYPWLKRSLEARGYTVDLPALPKSGEPDADEQADYVEKQCTITDKTVIVGVSFGGIVALRLLERGHHVQRVVLAVTPRSGKFLDGKTRKSVTAACKKGFDTSLIKKHAQTIIVLSDETDNIVPAEDMDQWVTELGAMRINGKASIPHFSAEQEPDLLMAAAPTIRVFTTRPDTIHGATYMVLAPEHPWVTKALTHKGLIKNEKEVREYITTANRKTELERQENKEKTGVKLLGVEALNPATQKKIPVYIADYVLAGYGTGAIMAVPAHDDRDRAFAIAHGLPITQVVTRKVTQTTGADAVHPGEPYEPRTAVMCIVKHWEKDEYLCQEWNAHEIRAFISGGIEEGEDAVAAGKREIMEESGYTNARFIRQIGDISTVEFYHNIKKSNRRVTFTYLYFELENDEQGHIAAEEVAKHSHHWKKPEEVVPFLTIKEKDALWKTFTSGQTQVHDGDGYMINSGALNGCTNTKAKKLATELYGRSRKTYRLRDWIVSRQRYWGVPIPMIHCDACGYQPVPEKKLPVELPRVTDYLPTGDGKSPLAKATKWVKTTCPVCKKPATRETDTLDTFVDSSWYFLRYTDPKNKTSFASRKQQKQWMPVDLYSGGAEHTTMHVLYSRFWQKALYDLKLVSGSGVPIVPLYGKLNILPNIYDATT
jgi:leucyl-tRNA synthetase/predicted esterase YcpF (UPF0227 family)